jgi:glucokinase
VRARERPHPGAGSTDAVTVGVDVGGTKVLGVVLDPGGSVVARARAATPAGHVGGGTGEGSADGVISAIAEVVRELGAGAARLEGAPLCVGIPGLVDDAGTMHFAPNLPAGAGVDFKARVEASVGAGRVVIDNDATCATVGEWMLGGASGATDAVVVTLGTGIGAGIVSNGALVRGVHGYAGEAGHMVVDPSGPLCSCGRRGCWERYASGSGLARLAREAASAGRLANVMSLVGGDAESVRGEHVTEAAGAGDPGALEVMRELGWWIALGLANLTALLDPSVIVIGGGLAAAGEILLEPTRRAYAEIAYASEERPVVRIVAASLGELAGAVGAALIARGATRSETGAACGSG